MSGELGLNLLFLAEGDFIGLFLPSAAAGCGGGGERSRLREGDTIEASVPCLLSCVCCCVWVCAPVCVNASGSGRRPATGVETEAEPSLACAGATVLVLVPVVVFPFALASARFAAIPPPKPKRGAAEHKQNNRMNRITRNKRRRADQQA